VTDPTARERQARFAERIREQGFIKICEWVPAECRDTLKRIARDMRDGVAPDLNYTPPPEPTPPQQEDNLADKVRQAHGWGWTPAAIANYLGISAEQVDRILGDGDAA
jgi:hypothetical protein